MREIDIIFDRYGSPLVRLLSDGRFVSFYGINLGFLRADGTVYTYSGRHIGWYEKGILRDINGYCVGFGKNPRDIPMPLMPIRQIPPIPSITQIPPIKPICNIHYIKPIKSFYWSNIELSKFFFQ